MRRHRWILMPVAAIALLVGLLAVGTSRAAAQDDGLTIPASTVIYGSPGDVIELGRLPVDNTRAGPLCTWTATVTNQASVHPGNNILVESNGSTLVLADVEATANKVTTNSGSVFLADEVVVSLQLGPDGRFSGRMELAITYSRCEPVPTTTTTTTTTTTEETVPSVTTPTSETSSTVTVSSTTDTTAADTTEATEPEGPEVSATDATTTTVSETTQLPATSPTTTPTSTDTLPVTGSELTIPLVGAGLALLIVGLGLVSTTRRRES